MGFVALSATLKLQLAISSSVSTYFLYILISAANSIDCKFRDRSNIYLTCLYSVFPGAPQIELSERLTTSNHSWQSVDSRCHFFKSNQSSVYSVKLDQKCHSEFRALAG